MKNTLIKGMAATALTGGALALGTGMANAAPAKNAHPAPTNPYRVSAGIAPGVTYTGDSKSGAAEITTPWGTFKTSQGRMAVSNPHGKTVFGDPTTKGLSPATQAPVALRKAPAPLQPGLAAAAAPGSPTSGTRAAAPKKLTQAEKTEAIEGAIGKTATNFGLAYGVGAMIGGTVGGVIGCPIGAVAMQVALPVPVIGAILGCGVGISTFGTTGAIIGGAMVGFPVGIVSGVQQYQSLAAQGALG